MDTPAPFPGPQERLLFRRVADGSADAEEFRELEGRLLRDPELRSRFILQMALEADLHEELHELNSPVHAVNRQRPSAHRKLRRLQLAVIGLSLVAVLAATPWWSRPAPEVGLPVADVEQTGKQEPPAPNMGGNSGLFVAETVPLRPHGIAIVTYVSENPGREVRDWFHAGQRFGPGVITVPGGELQLEFLNGAQVLLKGPARLRILDVKSVTLELGQAAAHVPKSAIGFVMNGPGAAVVDLGTAFSMNVDEDGQSNVRVSEGEVEVSLLGQDGNTVKSERVIENGAVRVSRNSAQLETLPTSAPLLTIPQRPAPMLRVTPEYTAAVKSAGPFAYWRFEQLHNDQVSNEMGPGYSAVLHREHDPDALTIEEGTAVFQSCKGPRFLSVDEGLPGWNSEAFTIELWVCPRRLHFGTIVDILNDDWSGDLNAIEIPLKTSWIHPPGAFRFLHRHPPGQKMTTGINLFDHETCTPGQWAHIVAVKTPTYLSLSINGQEVRRIQGTIECDHDRYQLLIGQMENHGSIRQFEGAIDEIALYHHALDPEEILLHYQLLD